MLELKQIKKDYVSDAGTVSALKGINLQFRNNEFVSILGQSGCGKTTMLNIIGGLDHYTSGDLIINGVSTKEYKDRDWDSYRNHSVGFVFQTYNLIPHQTVLQNVELALTLSGVSKHERKQRAIKALEEVGLKDQINKKPNAMSGGQMQRVAIARALVNNPDIILADEPTGALDTETSLQVMEILKRVAKDRLVIMVTHNPELAQKYSTRIIKMLDGKIVDDSKPLSDREFKHAQKQDVKKLEKRKKEKKPKMSAWTSFKLSLKNLFTKKGRTTLTSFAGSIGIIGIALILAVSQGMTGYINHVQETTLSSYPLTLEEETMDMTSLIQSFMNVSGESDHDNDAVYKDPIIGELVNALSSVETSQNDLGAFKIYLEAQMANEESKLASAVSGIQYSYDLDMQIYTENIDGEIIKSDTGELMSEMIGKFMKQVASNGNANNGQQSNSTPSTNMFASMMTSNLWQELLPGTQDGQIINNLIYDQYELVDGGTWPNEHDEIVLVLNKNNELDDLTLYALGLLSKTEIDAIIDAAANGQTLPKDDKSWAYSELSGRTFKTILPADYYQKVGNIYADFSNNETFLKMLYQDALELKVTGIIRPKADAEASMLSGTICYTHKLTEYVINKAKQTDVVKAQIATPNIDVLTGLPFESNTGTLTNAQKEEAFKQVVAGQNSSAKAQTYTKIQCVKQEQAQLETQTNAIMANFTNKDALIAQISSALAEEMGISAEQIATYLQNMSLDELKAMLRPTIEQQVKNNIKTQVEADLSAFTEEELATKLDEELLSTNTEQFAVYYDQVTVFSSSTYEDNLKKLGAVDLANPSKINIYASSFENKDVIVAEIDSYNSSVDETKKIAYTDYMGLMMSSITQIIDAITYVLIAFVAISLIVSSIMIGVITLISVQERTKEIGILRAIGASKRDVSSMFNAETLIIGFSSGMLGVLITYLLCIPINIILHALTGVAGLNAVLPVGGAVILVLISMGLTLISGLIPSRSAAKKDPVIALRTE
ncbi:MAG: ABC transporter ATP-binding protein/permease [Clostridia bacterium]|nr:ABC transporter ATP-binding protein/permease [Clostridia bacterium]